MEEPRQRDGEGRWLAVAHSGELATITPSDVYGVACYPGRASQETLHYSAELVLWRGARNGYIVNQYVG